LNYQNILIFRIGHLGDSLVALPALWAIRKAFPAAHITLLTNIDVKNPHYISPRNILPQSGLIDSWLSFPTTSQRTEKLRALVRLLVDLRREKYDALIYLMPRMRNRRQIDRDRNFFRLAGISNILGMRYLSENSLDTEIPKPVPSVTSEAEFLCDLLENCGIPIDKSERNTVLLLTDRELAAANSILTPEIDTHTGKTLIGVAPGTKWESKKWSADRFESVVARLIAEHSCYPIVFGGAEDHSLGNHLISRWGIGLNTAGRMNVRESAALLGRCDLYLGNDTGTMHLAAAMNTPCVAIFSAIDWRGRWHPFGTRNRIFRKTVECEGCNTPHCFNDHKCLKLIEEADVYSACEALLGK